MRGFTLKQIVVVLAIVAVLAALVEPVVHVGPGLPYQDLALAKCRDIHDTVVVWMKLTKATAAPADLKSLEQPLNPFEQPFMLVEADPWGQQYRIELDGPRAFRIYSNGPDAEPGTDDDICYEPLDER